MVFGMSSAWLRMKVLLFFAVSGMTMASAQSLSSPLAEIPSPSLLPPEQLITNLPPAASNLLAPTSGSEAPVDDLGANLQSTSSNPFISAEAGGRPAAAVDTLIRGTFQLGPRSPGQPASRSLYSTAQAAQWAGSGATSSMKGVQLPGVRSSISSSSWGLAATSNAGSSAMAMQTSVVAKSKRSALRGRSRALSSGSVDASSPFQLATGNAETQSSFGQSPFESLGDQQRSFLNPDLTAVLHPQFTRRTSAENVGLPGNNEMDRLRAQLHPPAYSSSYGKKTSRVTMKSLIEQESQSDSTAPTLPPIFFMPQ